MPYLISILAACGLFAGFLLLAGYEQKRGVRFMARQRYALDRKVSRSLFVFEHVDWGAFLAHATRSSIQVMAHDLAHGTLMIVRAFERTLTRMVRSLRMQRDGTLPLREPGESRLDGTMSYLKRNLNRSRKAPQAPTAMTDIMPREKGE
jgi:hypothetical protein